MDKKNHPKIFGWLDGSKNIFLKKIWMVGWIKKI